MRTAQATIGLMSNRKHDRHKPGHMVRIPKALYDRLERLARRNVTKPTQEAIRAVREYLERAELWPPSGKSD